MKIPALIAGLMFCTTLLAQEEIHHDHEGHHHKNEIGIANAPVIFLKEDHVVYGLHLHYVRQLGESRFGLGLGYERLFDEHGHNTIGLVGSYRSYDRWNFNISPGLTFEDESSELFFAFHLESAYEFSIGDFHLGPVAEFAYDPEDIHLSIGLHLGYGF